MDNKALMMESTTLFIGASTPEADENSQVLNQIEFTRCTACLWIIENIHRLSVPQIRNESPYPASVPVTRVGAAL